MAQVGSRVWSTRWFVWIDWAFVTSKAIQLIFYGKPGAEDYLRVLPFLTLIMASVGIVLSAFQVMNL